MTNSSGTGAVKCWGRDFDGELGNGVQLPGADTNVPTPVLLPNQVTSVACGTRSSCALENSGTARCWGWDRDGGLGDGMLTDSSTPLQVQDSGAPMSGISQVSSGGRFACALLSYGGVKCWGLNDAKQLGGKALGTYSYTPVDVPLY
jgi:alpha-tubulin suppressor-like RCC1 family protein